jgi:hypothetical protein
MTTCAHCGVAHASWWRSRTEPTLWEHPLSGGACSAYVGCRGCYERAYCCFVSAQNWWSQQAWRLNTEEDAASEVGIEVDHRALKFQKK